MKHGSEALQQSFCNDLACCLDNADAPREAQEMHRHAIELAPRAGRPDEAATACTNLATSLRNCGDMQGAMAQLLQARRHALGYDEALGATWHLDLATLAILRDLGRFDEALRAGELALLSLAQHPVALPVGHGHLACLWLHLGQGARARQSLLAAQAVPVRVFLQARLAQLQGRLAVALDRPARASFTQAQALAPQAGRTVLQSMIALDHALVLPPEQALAVPQEVVQRGERLGYAGVALAGRIRAARFARLAGQTDQARQWARAALDTPPDIEPDDLYRGELWLQAALALRAGGAKAAARDAADIGANWVRQRAQAQVPAPFRDSFVHRNPVNRDLLALAG